MAFFHPVSKAIFCIWYAFFSLFMSVLLLSNTLIRCARMKFRFSSHFLFHSFGSLFLLLTWTKSLRGHLLAEKKHWNEYL